ncbi:MAG: helix-hairpin-helix domain-containing protein [Angelakisella sp.]
MTRLFSLGIALIMILGSTALADYQVQHQLPVPNRVLLNRRAGVMSLEEFLKLSDVELNSATQEQLEELPGVGKVLAKRILEYRQQNGPFTSVEQLLSIKGIGVVKLEQICRCAYLE